MNRNSKGQFVSSKSNADLVDDVAGLDDKPAKSKKAKKLEVDKPVSGGYIKESIPEKSGKFVIVGVQNNTDLHQEFWPLLVQYATDQNAEIICCPILYNRNAWAQPDDVEYIGCWFALETKQYMVDNRVLLNGNTLLIGDAHVLPTAKHPTNSYSGASLGADFIVIPASTIELNCLAALPGDTGKMLVSTGVVTQKNYLARKVGVLASDRHCFGFVVVEPGKVPRSINYVNGAFYDFNGNETVGYGVTSNESPYLVLGDIHAEKCSEERMAKMYAIAEAVQPRTIVIHDLHDFQSRNHHSRKNPFFRMDMDNQGNSVEGDLWKAFNFLQYFSEFELFIVSSNHDRALKLWLENNYEWHNDLLNADTYLRLCVEYVKHIKNAETPFNALQCALDLFCAGDDYTLLEHVTFGDVDESFMMYGQQGGHHGDSGPNGSRGSIEAFSKLGQGMVIGHSHSPAVRAGTCVQVGVGGNMLQGYNVGPSSWRHAHAVVFPNGQTQLHIEA